MSVDQTAPSSRARLESRRRLHHAEGGTIGALAGAALGALAGGPGGAVAGAVIGAGLGVVTAWAVQADALEAAWRDRHLDAEIGVTKGDLGSPNLEHPPAKIGAFSREVSGAGSSVYARDAEGPIPTPPDD